MGGTAFFALKTDALMIPCYRRRSGGGRFVLRYDDPIELGRTDDFDEEVYLMTPFSRRWRES